MASKRHNVGVELMNTFTRNMELAKKQVVEVVPTEKQEQHTEEEKVDQQPISSEVKEPEIDEKIPAVKSGVGKKHAKKAVPRREKYVHYGIELTTENCEYLKKIKRVEGEAIVKIINGVFDEHRQKYEEALDETLAELEHKSKAWRK